ncbi:Oidioi.mRNA.OKI2018_I69.chr2.g5566.t1.cds [Oikopleura dioica]|uniref:Oidioi.mRNA.OKI2018_I69.chr2.g5566.t1.cds n=1 Tax=Oikopleura dioica TaxID=34765 RepID=A0ABN7T400_OIKDI|nr:Oidioi.mRNA.OKI2018_I69.chr2.g5566.t1.cds [Oikopleura dioica]
MMMLENQTPQKLDMEPEKTKGKRKYQRRGKPPYSYVALVAICIQSSPSKKLRLREILKNIEQMFPFFQGDYRGWKDSVRHNLTQNDCFRQILRDPSKPNGKGNFWTVAVEAISGEMYKRQNTSVAYQAPEGKTYVADLRQVYDFFSGTPKPGVPHDPSNPMTIFENVILQDISSPNPALDFKGQPDLPPFANPLLNPFALAHAYRQQQQHAQIQAQHPASQTSGFMMPMPSNNFSYANSTSGSLSSSPSSSFSEFSPKRLSPSFPLSPADMLRNSPVQEAKQNEEDKVSSSSSSERADSPTGVVEHRPRSKPTLKRKRSPEEEKELQEQSEIKKCKQELKKTARKVNVYNLDSGVTPPNVALPNVKPKAVSTGHKHSIRSILNLDQSEDLSNGPPVVELDGRRQLSPPVSTPPGVSQPNPASFVGAMSYFPSQMSIPQMPAVPLPDFSAQTNANLLYSPWYPSSFMSTLAPKNL